MTKDEVAAILQNLLDGDTKSRVPDAWPIPISKALMRKIVELLKG